MLRLISRGRDTGALLEVFAEEGLRDKVQALRDLQYAHTLLAQ